MVCVLSRSRTIDGVLSSQVTQLVYSRSSRSFEARRREFLHVQPVPGYSCIFGRTSSAVAFLAISRTHVLLEIAPPVAFRERAHMAINVLLAAVILLASPLSCGALLLQASTRQAMPVVTPRHASPLLMGRVDVRERLLLVDGGSLPSRSLSLHTYLKSVIERANKISLVAHPRVLR